jgi:hypothetical protein
LRPHRATQPVERLFERGGAHFRWMRICHGLRSVPRPRRKRQRASVSLVGSRRQATHSTEVTPAKPAIDATSSTCE